MKREFSAGIVVFFQENNKEREYLLLHYEAGHWDFAKGHIEGDESKEQAAFRELQEETGLAGKEVTLVPGFEQSFEYFFKNDDELILKKVYFFIGRSVSKTVKLSSEHIGYQWLHINQAFEQLTYKNAKELLHQVDHFLKIHR